MSLTHSSRGIIAGTILGDGCLERNGPYVRLRIDHGARQKFLVEWKHQQLAELHPTAIRCIAIADQRTGRTYVHYRFETASSPLLEEYYRLFYPHGKKACRLRLPRILPLHSVLPSGTSMMAAEGETAVRVISTPKHLLGKRYPDCKFIWRKTLASPAAFIGLPEGRESTSQGTTLEPSVIEFVTTCCQNCDTSSFDPVTTDG